ncbi:MAG TPA: outer membrane lipoprotein carrier protein LolA [Blastocatellia bacterium]|nr:outer membrane lipoprotein carrier protein LolA [Blastocatellia bacterium]
MKRFISLAVIAGITLLLAGADRHVNANAQPQILTGILNKMRKANQELKSLKAEIVQEKTNNQIGVTDTTYGQLLYKPDVSKSKRKLRIDYTKPSQDILAVDGDNFVFYQPRIKQAIRGFTSKVSKGKQDGLAQILAIVLSGSLESASGEYDLSAGKDEMVNGIMTSLLRAIPKSNKQFTSIDIWISQQSSIPVRFSATERNGDVTVFTFKNMQLNASVPDSAFNLKLPSGTEILKN